MTAEKAVKILKANDERRIASTYIRIKDLAIKALEKQIPKKPIDTGWLYCPDCQKTVDVVAKNKYCHDCGQALDWSDV